QKPCCGENGCCCCSESQAREPGCCKSKDVKKSTAPGGSKKKPSPKSAVSTGLVPAGLPGLSALQCSGNGTIPSCNGDVSPAVAIPSWQPTWNPAGWLAGSVEKSHIANEPPPSPPPRFA